MAYNPNIPQPTDQLSKSQSDILNNFLAIKQLIDVNHVTFNAPDQGKHNLVTFPRQAIAPTNAGTDVSVYSALSAFSGLTELNYRRSNNTSVEFTSGGYVVGTQAVPGWTVLPSGIMLKWGIGTAVGSVLNVILNAAGQPTYSACYVGLGTTVNFATQVSFFGFTGTGLATYSVVPNNQQAVFLIIGLVA